MESVERTGEIAEALASPAGQGGGFVRGLATVVAVGTTASLIGGELPTIGAPIVALVIGIGAASRGWLGDGDHRVAAFVGKYLLQAAIVVFGASVSFSTVVRIGSASLPVLLTSLAAAFVSAWALGRLLKVPRRLATLIGVGTGICGASAIAAVSPIIGASEAEIAYSVASIFAFNVAAVVVFPLVGHLAGFGQHAFGLWAGTAVNDTSSVVATAFSYGREAGQYAVLVKLARTAMIIPTAAVLLLMRSRRREIGSGGRPVASGVPWFLLLFCLAATLNSLGIFRGGLAHEVGRVAVAAFTFALAAVGISVRPRDMRKTGVRPLLLGAGVWAAVAVTAVVVEQSHLLGL